MAAARVLPNEASREGTYKLLRIELSYLADECLVRWSILTAYIRDAYPEEMYDTQRQMAGYSYY